MIKRTIILIYVIGAILTLLSCSSSDYKKISAKEAKAMMDESGVIVVDVREQSEYDSGHIENAILMPLGEIDDIAEAILPNKDSVVLVYCRSGNRSATAAEKLISLGYNNVYDFGGIIDWPYGIITD